MQVDGRTFLVTGGGSGLGAATARLLSDSGANVVVADLGRREEIGRFVETDVRDETSVQAAVDTALGEHIVENRYLNGEVIRIDGALRAGPR